MGLTKQYLRYIPAGNFNIIASSNCNAEFVCLEGQEGRFVAVGACEHVIIWDLRLGEKAQVLPGEKAVVTRICASPNKRHIAVGYSDGNIQIYDLKSAEIVCIFSGHHSEVTALAYDSFGHKLASGAKDIIVWDTVAEVGICRLSGHKGNITQLVFMSQFPNVISGSKDGTVKFWDLDTQHCFKTLVGLRTEVWALCLLKEDRYLVTGGGDSDLKVWKLSHKDQDGDNKNSVEHLATTLQLATLEDEDDPTHPLQCHQVGTLLRSSKGRVVSMCTDVSGQILGCHGTDKLVEIFNFCSDEEAQSRMKKRIKKARKKEKREEPMEVEEEAVAEDKPCDDVRLTLRDEVKRLTPVKLSSKPKSLHLVLGNGGELRVAITLANNSLELYTLQTSIKDAEPKCLRSIKAQGHHGEIRTVCFSSDNLGIVSGSSESVKLWNRPSQACIRTVATGYVISTCFVPGDRHVLAGQKDGKLLIIDISTGDILEEISAHEKEIWSICLYPDLRGCVTGSGDGTVKFWQFELVADEKSESKAKILTLSHTKTLKLDEGVLCVRLSPNGKYVAVALLDSTVKIHFVDTFKFYLSLYGHKLPVLCMDISSDSTLIATGSSDRNVKIWGLDFGDCHRSLFAHDDSVTGLQFVPRTHYFFTCGKDGKVKQWDGDSFNKIITLQGHAGEARNLAVSPNGNFVVSCGADHVLRLYEKSDQPLVLEDEEEEEREQLEGLATGETTTVPSQPGLNLPSKKTIGSEKGAESILECLEMGEKFKDQLAEHKTLQASSSKEIPLPQPPPLMQALNCTTPEEFLLETIRRIRASDLEESLLILPFNAVCEILQTLSNLVTRGDDTELICKIVMFLLKLHHKPIVANHMLLTTLKRLQSKAFGKVQELRDVTGYNLYGMKFLQREIENTEGVQLFRDATMERKKGEKKRKQREKHKRSIIVLNT